MLFLGNNYNYWIKTDKTFDISRGANYPYTIQTSRFFIKFDPTRSALVVNDMQNYFLSKKANENKRVVIVPILNCIKHARRIGIQVVWINWGLSSELLTISPSLLWSFQNNGLEVKGELGRGLEKDSCSAEVIDEFKEYILPTDFWIDKHRIGGFQGTELHDLLASKGIQTLFFSGIHTDQSVLATIYDAHSIGYDCILLSDCTSTNSPNFAYNSAIYTVKKLGFVTESSQFLNGAETDREIGTWIEKQIGDG
jgi:nicotinamidase-related amidase